VIYYSLAFIFNIYSIIKIIFVINFKACKDDKINETVLVNFAILQKKLLDVEFNKKLYIPADKVNFKL